MILDPLPIGLSVVVCSLLAVVAFRIRALDGLGALAAFAIGFLLLILPAGGWMWFIVMLAFLVSSHALTLFMYEEKLSRGVGQEKRGTRSWPNVLANGLVPTVCTIGTLLVANDAVLVRFFLGSVSVAAADTFATEVGLLSPDQPRLLTQLHEPVMHGSSGAVSPLGLLASLAGASVIAGVGFAVGLERRLPILLVVVAGGLVGALFDSALGSKVQGIYECAVCRKSTEHREHCGRQTKKIRGKSFLGNNSVNFLANLVGGVFAALIVQVG